MFLLALSRIELIVLLISVLVLQWFLAMTALYLLFKDTKLSKKSIAWNIFIMFGIIIGPVSYYVYRYLKKNGDS